MGARAYAWHPVVVACVVVYSCSARKRRTDDEELRDLYIFYWLHVACRTSHVRKRSSSNSTIPVDKVRALACSRALSKINYRQLSASRTDPSDFAIYRAETCVRSLHPSPVPPQLSCELSNATAATGRCENCVQNERAAMTYMGCLMYS